MSLPPPPPFPKLSTQLHSKCTSLKKELDLPYEKESLWAKNFPEIQKACYFSNSRISSIPQSCEYSEIPSILQVGPTCGLAAVSMMLLGSPTPAEILEVAISRNFTNFGEMFSTENLKEIIEEVVPKDVKSFILQGNLNSTDFRKELIDGSLALVTYPFYFIFIFVILR